MKNTTSKATRLPSALEIRNKLLSKSLVTRQRAALDIGKDHRIFTQEATALVSAIRLDLRCMPSAISLPTVMTMARAMRRISEQVHRATPVELEHLLDECCEFYGLLQGWYTVHVSVEDDFCEILNDVLDAIQDIALAVPLSSKITTPSKSSAAEPLYSCEPTGGVV